VSSFLDQFQENVRMSRRRWPQRLLKVVIVIGAVLIVAPCASVVGRAFGPTAAFAVALCGLLATIAIWWLASLLLARATAPTVAPIVPPQPGSPFAAQGPAVTTQAPAAPRNSGAGLAIVVALGVLMFSCCGGGVMLVALLATATAKPDAAARVQPDDDPFAEFNRGQRQMEEQLRRQEKQIRDLERNLQRDPFGR